jgi:hypothetical protein
LARRKLLAEVQLIIFKTSSQPLVQRGGYSLQKSFLRKQE